MADAADVIRIEMTYEHTVDILRLQPKRRQMLVYGLTLRERRMIERGQPLRQYAAHSLRVIAPVRTYLAAPAAVEQQPPKRVLYQKREHGQLDARPVRTERHFRRTAQPKLAAVGHLRRHADAAAAQGIDPYMLLFAQNITA